MFKRQAYLTDLTDKPWEVIKPYLPGNYSDSVVENFALCGAKRPEINLRATKQRPINRAFSAKTRFVGCIYVACGFDPQAGAVRCECLMAKWERKPSA
jgi:hypothetical protein